MARLPSAYVYEAEFAWWPWGALVQEVVETVAKQAPIDGHVIDYMSGTGFLLRSIATRRPDLAVTGCDLSLEFQQFARLQRTQGVRLVLEDALAFRPERAADVVVVTGGLHHLPYSRQPELVAKLAGEIGAEGTVIIGEEVVAPYTDERSRRLAALELGQALIRYGVETGWPDPLFEAALGVLGGDLLLDGEYKRDIAGWQALISAHLQIQQTLRLWTTPAGGGDVIFVCGRRGDA